MSSVESVEVEIRNAQQRLGYLSRLTVKFDADWQMIDEMKEYLASLFKRLEELKVEAQAAKKAK